LGPAWPWNGEPHPLRGAGRDPGSGRDDRAGVARHRGSPLEAGRSRHHRAAAAKAGIEAAVAEIAREHQDVGGPADGDEAAAGPYQQRERALVAGEIRHHDAFPTEARVDGAVGSVAHEREIGAALAGDNDLPVGLERDRAGGVDAAEIREDLPVTPEARVDPAHPVVAHERDVAAARSRDDDRPAPRDRDRVGVVLAAEIGADLAAVPEAPVQLPRRGQRGGDERECGGDAGDRRTAAHRSL
jgi:hypothetical protein